MEINDILKIRDILYTICPLMTSDCDNILNSVENPSLAVEHIRKEIKTVFDVDLHLDHAHDVLSVQSLLRMIKTPSDIKLNNSATVPLEKKIVPSLSLPESDQIFEDETFELGVISAACRLPGGIRNTEDFWKFLVQGRSANERIPLNRIPTRDDLIRGVKYGNPVEGGNFIDNADIFKFDHSLFRISRSEAEWIDPQQRLLLECVYECLENAGLLPDLFVQKNNNNGESSKFPNKEVIGVFVGLMETEYPYLMKEGEHTGVLSMLGSMTSVVAGRISYVFGCTGPTLTVDTACSSSLMAIELAKQSLKEKKCTKAIVAGVNLILTETALGHRANGKMLSEHGMSYSFDARASGYGRADGCSVVLLERAKESSPYLGIIEKINSNHCGRGVSLTAPNGYAHDELISGLFDEKLTPNDISYWEAHGTGTPLGDPIELNVLARKLGETNVGSVKSSVGHGEAAAGTTSLIKCLMMIKNSYIPPALHFHVLNEQINARDVTISVVGEEKELARCGISSFGVSGTNVALVVRKANNNPIPEEDRLSSFYLLLLSGKTSASLNGISEKVQERIDQGITSLNLIASSLSHRPHFNNFRLALIYDSEGEQLESFRTDRREGEWSLSFIHIDHELNPDILQITRINQLFLNQPKERSREAKLRFALFEFLNEFSPTAELRTMSAKDFVLLLGHQNKLELTEKFLDDLERTFTLDEVTHLLEVHKMKPVDFPSSFEMNPDETCAYPINSLRSLLRVVAFSYSHGENDNYKIIYDKAQEPINGLNYCFDRKDIWFRKRSELFDHYLIGRKVTDNDKLVIYENQLSALRHPKLFLRSSNLDSLQADFSATIEMICAAVEAKIECPVHIWNLKTVQIPEQSDKEFLKMEMSKDEEDIWHIKATIGPHFFFSCNGENKKNHQKISEKIKTDEVISSFKGEQDHSYQAVCSQLWHMGKDVSSMELFLYKPLTTEFEIKKFHSNTGIAVVTQEDLLLEIYFAEQSLPDNGKVLISKESKVAEEETCERARNHREEIRKVIIEALNDVIPDGLDWDLTNSDTGFMEFGLDSLSLIEFVNRLNSYDLLTYEVSTSDVFDFPSIDSLNDFLFRKTYKNDEGTSGTGGEIHVSEQDKSSFVSQAKEKTLNILLQALDDVLMEPLSNVDVKSGFMQLGLDSIGLVDFINRLNDRYFPSLNITTSHLFEFVNLDELTDYIVSKNQEEVRSNIPLPSDFHLARKVKPPDDYEEDGIIYKLREVSVELTPHCTITLDSLQLKVNDHKDVRLEEHLDKLPPNSLLNFDIHRKQMSDSDIFQGLCDFGRMLIKSKAKVRLVVQNTSKSENKLAISFFKTLSAEQYPNIEFIWTDRIHRVCSSSKDCKPIEGSWLVTGGLSGIGWACATWLAKFVNVKEIHLVSRRQSPDFQTAEQIETLKQQGTNILFHRADVSDFNQMLGVFQKLKSPLNGIIHSAGILRDCRIERQNRNLFEDVYKPKVKGFTNLDELLTKFKMKPSTFLVMSSFTAVCGNIGQSNYGVVNTIMEQKVKERRKKGHCGTIVISWGNWREIGMASDPKLVQHLEGIGLPGLNTEQALNCIPLAIDSGEENILVAAIDFDKLLSKRKDMPSDLLLSHHNPIQAIYDIPYIGLNIFYDDEISFEEQKKRVVQSSVSQENVNTGRFVEEVMAKSMNEFYEKLNELTCSRKERIPMHRMVWLFPGQGSHYVGMSREFSAIFPKFREQFSNNLQKAQNYFDQDLTEVITRSEMSHYLEQTSYGQPLLVCFCHALYVLWDSVGLPLPDFLLGHSIGELVAGVIAEMLTLEQALMIAVSRGKAMEKSKNRGGLLAVDIPNVYELISRYDVHVSSYNSKNQTVLAGELEKLEQISNELKSKGSRATLINDAYPFHSPLIHNDDLEELKLLLDSIEFGHSETGIISCITGEKLHKFSTAYLISHVTQPVNFSKCIEKLKNCNVNIWLELGPGQLLSSLIQKTLMSENVAHQHLVCSTCSGKSCDIENFVKTALDLEKAGVFISWNNIFLNNSANNEEERLITWPIVETHTISNEEEQILKCHIVRDEVIIPAAYQLTKVYEWISKLISGPETIELTNIKLFSPWKLTSGKHFKTTLTFSNQVILEVQGQRITTCQIQYKEKRNRLIDINIWKEQCKEELDIKNYYKQQAANGTEYGQYFQLLYDMKIGGNKIMAKAHLKSTVLWPLIDSSFHSVCPLMLTRRADLIFIPAAISSIDMILSNYKLNQSEIWILSEILEYNEKFIRVNSCVTLCPDGTNDYEIIFQGTNEISVMDSTGANNNIVTSATTSQYTNDCSSVQSESWQAEENDELTGSIGIIGYDCMFCHDAFNPEALWDNLISHKFTNNYIYKNRTSETSPTSGSRVGLIDAAVHEWEPEFFGISPREAPYVDVSQRLLLKIVSRCLERTGISELPKRTAVLVGLSGCDFEQLAFAETIRENSEKPNGFYTTGIHRSCAAGRLAHFLGTEGPALTLDTACSSSMSGIWLAYEMLASCQCDMAIIAAVNVILTDHVTNSLQNAGMLSDDADPNCKAFDASANGYKRSEGVACIILTKESFLANSTIPSDIPMLAKIACCNLGHNGTASALHVPNGRSQFRVMSVDGTRVIHTEHVECHGSGTALGDVIECRAIASELQGGDNVTISSIKSYLGHTESVSGLASLITALMQIQNGYRLPQPHISLVNRQLDSNHLLVNFVGQEANIERIRVNNFGFSGTIGSFILEKSNRVRHFDDESFPQYYQLAVISAKSMSSLKSYSKSFFDFLKTTNIPLEHICAKLQRGRNHYRYRRCFLMNLNSEILWDSEEDTKSVNDAEKENWEGLSNPETIAFCFSFSVQLHLRNGSLTIQAVNDFLSELGSVKIEKVNPMLFHKAIGKSYVKGNNIKWKNYYRQIFDFSTIALPSYEFHERPFWPFTKDCIRNLFYKRKRIGFSRKLILKNNKRKGATDNRDVHAISSSSLDSIPIIRIEEIPRVKKSKLLFEVQNSSIESAMTLIEIWKLLDITHENTLFVIAPSNGTRYSEWTGILRSLASEKAHSFIFVSYQKLEEVRNELANPDVYETIFYKNSERFVERLCEIEEDTYSSPHHPKSLLLSGSEGGLGKEVQKFLQPKSVTKISRRLGDSVATFSNFKESYDMICHCAGLVKNAPFQKMRKEDFQEIWEAKVAGFMNLEKVSSLNDCPIVVFSSIASILGSAGQANYSFVNGLMTSLSEKSKCPTKVLHLGPCLDVGMLSGDEMMRIRQGILRRGWNFIESNDILDRMNTKEEETIIFDGNFSEIVKRQPHLNRLLTGFYKKNDVSSAESSLTLVQILQQVSGITDFEGDFDTPFMKFGIDSLMMEEIRELIQKNYRITLKSSELYENCTLNKMQKLMSTKASSAEHTEEVITKKDHTEAEEVAIVGVSGSFSGSDDIDDFWMNLFKRGDCLSRSESSKTSSNIQASGVLPNLEYFDHKFFNMSAEEASLYDPQLRHFLQHAYKALDGAGYAKDRHTRNVAVFASAEPNEYGRGTEVAEGSLMELFHMNQKDFTAVLTSHLLNLTGPSLGVYSACSSSLTALDMAIDSLTLKKVDLALVGSVSLIVNKSKGYVYEEGNVLSKTGYCRPFDVELADGIVRGSSVGCLVLKRLTEALEDGDHIWGTIKSIAVNNDGYEKASFMAPSSVGQSRCLQNALEKLNPKLLSRISYVECHGTATRVGDEIELSALEKTYGNFNHSVQIGSVKSNIGHGFAAAGIASIIKCLKILQTNRIPPHCHLKEDLILGDKNQFLLSKTENSFSKGNLIGVSSFGIGGTNGHVILQSVPPHSQPIPSVNDRIHILPISGRSEYSVKRLCEKLVAYLENNIEQISLESMAFTLQNRREHHPYRMAVTACSVQEAIEQFRRTDIKIRKAVDLTEDNIAFFFCPQGVLYPGIEKSESRNLPAFSKSLETLCEQASALCSSDFQEILKNDENNVLNETKYGQVANMILNLSIIKQLDSWSIRGKTLLGHSIGEYAAACCSGALDEVDCMHILKARGELCQKTPTAKMLTVRNSENALLPKDVEVSAILSESLRCLVGMPETIKELELTFEANEVDFKELKTDKGFHSSMMNEIKKEFEEVLLTFKKGSIPDKRFISSMDGEVKSELDVQYWIDHLRNPVRLDKSLQTVCQDPKIKVLIEIGPSGILQALVEEIRPDISVVHTVQSKKQSENPKVRSQMIQCMADLWSLGYQLDFTLFGNQFKKSCYLPTYEFDLTHCWKEIPDKAEQFQFYKTTFAPIKADEDRTLKERMITIIIEEEKQIEKLEERFKQNSKILTSKEVFKMNSLSSDVIIYLPGNEDLLEPFHLVKHFYEIIKGKYEFLIISDERHAHHSICIGPIRESILFGHYTTKFIVNQENLQLSHILDKLPVTEEHVLFMTSAHSYSMEFSDNTEESKELKEEDIGRRVLVLGGTGTIGQKYVEELLNHSFIERIIVCGRQHIDFDSDRVDFAEVDVSNEKSINNLMNRVWKEIDCIVHLVGQTTSPKLLKSKDEMNAVLQTKIFSTDCILKFLRNKKKRIKKLILASSLSSSLVIQGNDDYVSSNVYLNYLSIYGCNDVVKSISAIQLPFIRSSRMHSTYDGPFKKYFNHAVISLQALPQVIRHSLTSESCTAYSPMNPNKLRRLLLEKQTSRVPLPEPSHNEEDTVKRIWQSILSVDDIKGSSNFFELGGNSLSAMQLIWKINQSLNINVSSRKLFESPTFGRFVDEIRGSQKKTLNYPSLDLVHYEVPLLPSQEHMYFLHEMSQKTEYNLIFGVNFKSSDRVNIKTLRYSINSLIACQRSYRTVFHRSGTSISQSSLSLTESYQDLRKRRLSSTEQSDFIKNEKNFKFSLSALEPALHISFILCDNQLKVLFNQAHILTDGWSMTVLADNLQKFYKNYQNGQEVSQPRYTLAQYALEHQNVLKPPDDNYQSWIEELQKTEPARFPTNMVVPKCETNQFCRTRRKIPERIWNEVRSLARKYQTTEFVVVLTSYLLALRRYKADFLDDHIMIGCPISGRNQRNESFIGYFLNNMIINVEMPYVGIEQAIKIVEDSLSKSKMFEDVPYHRLMSDIRQKKNKLQNLFHLYFNFRHSLEYPKMDIGGISPEVEQISLNSIFDLSTTIDEKPSGPEILLEYNASKYSSEEVDMFINDILKHFAIHPPNTDIPLMVPTDEPQTSISEALIQQLANTTFKTSKGNIDLLSIHDLSLEISKRFLLKMGRSIRSDDLIAINFDRNESVEYILAVLLSGAGYVPIDTSWPLERQAQILENIHCDLIVERKSKEHSKKYTKKTVFNRNHSRDVTYVIHTSGSTANPKGVVVEHRNVMSFVTSAIRQIFINPSSIVLNSVNTVFDVSVSNIFTTLFASSTLAFQESPLSFIDDLRKFDCSYCFLPSAVFNQISSNQLEHLRSLDKLAIGGESINEHKLHQVLRLNVDVLQIYGPTETTVWSLTNRCKLGMNSGIQIGKPNSNEVCRISSDRSLCGELIINGPKVARGYLLSGNCFKSFNGEYSTSDLVFKWKDVYYFYGRLDHQIKIRGQLVNLHHIEEALMSIANLELVLVTSINDQLIAFVSKNESTMREKLSLVLPTYMVPSHFIQVSSLNLTTSGKVDRKKLLETFESYKRNKETTSEKGELLTSWIEVVVKDIFQKLTKTQVVEEDDDFFTIGGHSLLLMEMQTMIEERFLIKIDIWRIYEALTIKKLSKLIASVQYNTCEEGTTVPITTIRETSKDCLNIYFIHAVGGSILPYYAFLSILPTHRFNLYAIEYQLEYTAKTLKELAALYALSIAKHTKDKIPYLIGHSLGGIICREMQCDLELYTDYKISKIVMLDSWAINQQRLSVEKVKAFAEKVFMNLPDCEIRVQKAVALAGMLKNHKNTSSYTDIHLFKAEKLGDASFRLAVRSELDELGALSMIANGMEKYCLGQFHSYLLPGDHESCMKLHNLKHRKQEIQEIFKDLPAWK